MEDNGNVGKVPAVVVYVQDQSNKLYLGRNGWTLNVEKARPFKTDRQAQSALGAAALFGGLCGRMVLMCGIEGVMVTPKTRKKKATAEVPAARKAGK